MELMTKKELAQHSNYHAFCIVREDDKVVLRAKQFLFSKTWIPECGIKLLKDMPERDLPISNVAEFRIDHLNLNKVTMDLQRYYKTMELGKRMRVQSSFDRLRKKLESLPALKSTFEKLNISDLVQQRYAEVSLPEHLEHLQDDVEDIPELQGERFSEEFEAAEFSSEFVSGLIVCVYTNVKKNRQAHHCIY